MFLCREKFWKKFGKKFGKILTKSFLEKFWRALSNCFLSLLYSYNMLPSHAETSEKVKFFEKKSLNYKESI